MCREWLRTLRFIQITILENISSGYFSHFSLVPPLCCGTSTVVLDSIKSPRRAPLTVKRVYLRILHLLNQDLQITIRITPLTVPECACRCKLLVSLHPRPPMLPLTAGSTRYLPPVRWLAGACCHPTSSVFG